MSEHITYLGRLGNQLCQYITARCFAKRNRLKLTKESRWPMKWRGFAEEVCPPEGKDLQGEEFIVTDRTQEMREGTEVIDVSRCQDFILNGTPKTPCRFQGYFADPVFFQNRNEILRFFRMPQVPLNTDDICIHLRLGDYADFRGGCIIDPGWYLSILEQEKFKRLHIVTEERLEQYLERFERYDPVIQIGSPEEDFHYMRQFHKLVMANSSFSFWAAYFGYAQRVYTFPLWTGPNSSTQLGKPNFEGWIPWEKEQRFWVALSSFKSAWQEASKIFGYLMECEARLLFTYARKTSGRKDIAIIGEFEGLATKLLSKTGHRITTFEPLKLGPVECSNMNTVITQANVEGMKKTMKGIEHAKWVRQGREGFKQLEERSIGFLLIDGDHSPGEPLKDYEAMKPYLAKNAWVAFHDYEMYPGVTDAVQKLMQEEELKVAYQERSLIVLKRIVKGQKPKIPAVTRFEVDSFSPKNSDVSQLTILTMCKSRLSDLEQSFPSYMRQGCKVILIDYECPQQCGRVCLKAIGCTDDRIPKKDDKDWCVTWGNLTVYRFQDRKWFHMPEILNKGVSLCRTQWVWIMGCDMVLNDEFAEHIMKVAQPRRYIDFDTGPKSERGFYGSYGLQKVVFEGLGGYDEELRGYGYADTDFKTKLHDEDITAIKVPRHLAYHIDHDRKESLRHFRHCDRANEAWPRNREISLRKRAERLRAKGIDPDA